MELIEVVPGAKSAGAVVKATKGVTDKLKDDSLESLKEKIDKIIIDSGLNIVVFIDDIDRLDIRETQIVFKLVKLLAGFPRTAYVLALDDELVTKSLENQYATSASKQPGYTFLEKIIQIPLHLPKAEGSTLRQFTLEIIQNVHREINIQLTENEWTEFLTRFDMAFFPALTNPRTAILYANSIGFVIPLIGKEVNLSDLMILEAIKIFYPDIYHFIRSNPEHVLRKKEGAERTSQKVTDFNNIINKYSQSNNYLSYVLNQLFPLLYINGSYGSGTDEDGWFRKRRICSPKYFDRYFTYSVQPGEISDIYFEEMMEKLFKSDLESSTNLFIKSFSKVEVSTFLYKLSMVVTSLDEEKVFRLGLILRNVVNDFNGNDKDDLFPTSDRIIYQATSLAKQLSASKQGTYITEVIKEIQPFEIACKTTRSFLGIIAEHIVDKSELRRLSKICYEQIILRHTEYLAAGRELSQLHNNELWQVLNAYNQTGQNKVVHGFILAELAKNSRFAVRIIQMCSYVTYPPSRPEIYELQLLDSTKDNIEKLIPIADLYQSIVYFYGDVRRGMLLYPNRGSANDFQAIAKFQRYYLNGCVIDKETETIAG